MTTCEAKKCPAECEGMSHRQKPFTRQVMETVRYGRNGRLAEFIAAWQRQENVRIQAMHAPHTN